MLDMLNTIEHEIDLDATIRQLAHKEMGAYSPGVLHEKSCAINALKACITSQMEDIQDDWLASKNRDDGWGNKPYSKWNLGKTPIANFDPTPKHHEKLVYNYAIRI